MRGPGYRELLGTPSVRRALSVCVLMRIPAAASSIILTVHIVTTLGRGFSQAGLVVMCSTIALGISAPWWGRLLDSRGLRGTVVPQLLVLVAVWSVTPWVGYRLLVPLAVIGGLFMIPIAAIAKQSMIAAVDLRLRTAALALESLVAQVSFMAAPLLGVLSAACVGTRWTLLMAGGMMVLGSLGLCVINPSLVADDAGLDTALDSNSWVSPTVLGILGASAVSVLIVTGTEFSMVASLRSSGHAATLGWVLAAWALGCAVGALGYGALRRSISMTALLGLLAGSTLPIAFASNVTARAVLLFVAGIFCTPLMIATTDGLSRAVPPRLFGRVMGWQGTAWTIGGALGAPAAGLVIDRWGWEAGIIASALLGAVAALLGMLARVAGSRRAMLRLQASRAVGQKVDVL